MRVWERGSGETWACGTGACAAAVAAVLNGFCKKDEEISVILKGGTLKIRYTDEAVYLTRRRCNSILRSHRNVNFAADTALKKRAAAERFECALRLCAFYKFDP